MIEEIPGAEELVQSVAGLLKKEILPAVEQSELKFKLQVACNVLSIVERELLQGVRCRTEERQVLAAILNSDSQDLMQLRARLSAQISGGQFDNGIESLAEMLLPVVANRLAIDNPQYSTLVDYKKERE